MRSTAHADGWLEGDFSGQLELARVIGCKGDDPEVRAVERGVRLSKDDGVGEVEGLKAQSQRYAIVDRDGAEQGQSRFLFQGLRRELRPMVPKVPKAGVAKDAGLSH